MATCTVQVNYSMRPARIAFLVEKADPAVLEQIFRLNTTLWGGLLNPIVALDGRDRLQVGRHYAYGALPYEQELLALLRAFDPDILINYSGVDLPRFLAPFEERTFSQDVMRWNPWGTGETSSFLEVWPFLHHYWTREVRFLPKPNEEYGYIDLDASDSSRAFLVARFGAYPEGGDGNEVLTSNFSARPIAYNRVFRESFSLDKWVFPIHISSLQLEISRPTSFEDHIFFLLDTSRIFDVIDFWNLRAAGYRVFPLPLEHYEDFGPSAKAFAEISVYPINQNVTTNSEIVKARSVDDAELDKAGQWLLSLGAKQLSLQGWVPRFSDSPRDAGTHQEMQIRPPTSLERTEVVVFNDGRGNLRISPPDCELSGLYSSQHWATEIQALGTTADDRTFRLPWLRPACDAVVAHRIGRWDPHFSTRVSQFGMVTLQRADWENILIEEPTVTEVLRAYLKDGGFSYLKTSTPGLTLERIVEQFGGLYSCGVLRNSGVRKIIEALAHGKRAPSNEIRGTLYRSLPSDKTQRRREFESILSSLIQAQVLRQGFELQCSRCQRIDWYHLSELGTSFRCKKCFHDQLVPTLDGRDLYYVSDGLFRLEGKVAGSLTSLLSLLFIRQFAGHDAKYAPSFDYMDGTTPGERDFAVFASKFLRQDLDVIIGECKSLKEIGTNQRNAISQLGQRTGAYLAFCTLSDEFSADDRSFFIELVAAGQRPIFLTRKHLEMPYQEIGKYRHENFWPGRDAELLSRLTIRETLGGDFADKYRLHVPRRRN
jgi:hypothetical protein